MNWSNPRALKWLSDDGRFSIACQAGPVDKFWIYLNGAPGEITRLLNPGEPKATFAEATAFVASYLATQGE